MELKVCKDQNRDVGGYFTPSSFVSQKGYFSEQARIEAMKGRPWAGVYAWVGGGLSTGPKGRE